MQTRAIPKISVAAVLLLSLSSCRSQTVTPSRDQVIVPAQQTDAREVYAKSAGEMSFVYVVDGGTPRRLTNARNAWEADPILSSDCRLIAYSSGPTRDGRADIWIAHVDGSHAHRVSGIDQDASMPAFGPDGRTVFYAISRSFGHSSPIAASRRHDFDVVKVIADPDQTIPGSTSMELTQSYFRDLQSLSVSPDGEQFLVSTSGYPIGALLQEFWVDHPLRQHRIFQPHISGESSTGPSFGQARYLGNGMEIVFTAATEPVGGGDFDYNVYRISEVTGGDLTQLTHHKGMMDSLSVSPHGGVGFTDANSYSQVSLSVAEPLR